MWFIFGFITFISFTIYLGHMRINSAWKGNQNKLNGIAYQDKKLSNKGRMTGLLIGIDGALGYDYALKQETFIDRIFKFIGLSVEHQIESPEFDDLVYIVSDNPHVHQQLSSNNAITNAAIGLFEISKVFNCKIQSIQHRSGRLWIKYKTTRKFHENQTSILSAETVSLLKIISDELKQIPPPFINKWKDPFFMRASIILALSTGLAVNGAAHLFRLTWGTTPFTVDSAQLLMSAVYWGAGILVILLAASIILLGRSARAHLVMIEIILIGSFGAVSTAFIELRDMNMELDQSTASIYELKIHDKQTSRSRRSTRHYLYVDDWNNQGAIKKVNVSRHFYYGISTRDELVIKQKPGHFNFKWIESMEKKYNTQATTP